MNGRKLSELECCVLIVIKRSQPCTGYSVRKVFQQSLTTSWSASTGAIYPLLRKLLAENLIAEEDVAGDGRGTRRLSITPKGEAALRSWLVDVQPWIASPAADPIRTRSYLLSTLGKKQALVLIEEWRSATAQTLESVRAQALIEKDFPEDRRAFRGTELQLEARLQWLGELTAEFSTG